MFKLATTGSALSPQEIEFLALDEEITIIPNFGMSGVQLFSGETEDFKPQTPIKVPLWLALTLKEKGKCQIQLPYWLQLSHMDALLVEESKRMDYFEPMPFHYIEIGHLLLNVAKDDFKDAHLIQEKLVSIEERRHVKIMHGFQEISEPIPGLQLNGVGAMEINRIRDFVCQGLRRIVKVSGEEEETRKEEEE